MSPIGRVFIVFNLALAAAFAIVSGQLLQNQSNYKQLLADEQEARQNDVTERDNRIAALEKERGNAENAKSQFETQLQAANNSIARLQDDKKRLEELTSSQEANLKQLAALTEANQETAKSAFEDARKAYEVSIAAGKDKDDAVRAKDAAEAENRNLKNTIASLNEKIDGKNTEIAALQRDNDEQSLLVAAAKANGFLEAMAAPTIAGTVTAASGRLLTVAVADNPGNVDIQDQINRHPFRIAIYDESGYKAEAVATKYEPSANAILCNVMFKKDNAVIKTGDKASTKP